MNILLTGNAGFMGGYLTRALIKQGHAIIGVDLRRDPSQASLCRCIIGDICDTDLIRKAAHGTDLIVHLAALLPEFGISRREFFTTNAGGTESILTAASEAGVNTILFYSSVSVYGDGEADEDTPPSPRDDYGHSKLAAEEAIRGWVHQDKSRAALVIRPTVIFGVNCYYNMYRLIDSVLRRRFVWVGDGHNIKSLTYIRNLVAGTLFLMARITPGVHVFNYSDEPHLTAREIVETIAKYGDVPTPRLFVPRVIGTIGGRVMDVAAKISGVNFPITGARIRKFRAQTYYKSHRLRQFGFQQPFTLDQGFEETIRWYSALRLKQAASYAHQQRGA